MNAGRIEIGRLRRAVAGLPLPRAADGRLILAVDVSNWLRPDAATCCPALKMPMNGALRMRMRGVLERGL